MEVPRLVLASASPARRRVLADAGIEFEVVVSGVPEEATGSTSARVAALAAAKAEAVAAGRAEGLVLGCDSLLDVDGEAVGKPADPAAAAAVCRRLRGASATLYTGHCLLEAASGRRAEGVGRTVVRFGPMSDREVDAYVASGEPLELAGGFSLEGRGGPFVTGIDGDWGNVLGLSLPLLRELLGRLGVAVTDLWRPPGPPAVAHLDAARRAEASALVDRVWWRPLVTPTGAYDPERLDGLVAEAGGRLVGVLLWRRGPADLEVVALLATSPGRGTGSALLAAAADEARGQRRRLWLVATDGRPEAVAFYLRRHMAPVKVHRDFVSTVAAHKDVGPRPGYRHALELEYPAPGRR